MRKFTSIIFVFLITLAIPGFAVADKKDNATFQDLFARCLAYAMDGVPIPTDDLKLVRDTLATKISPEGKKVFHKYKGAYQLPYENWGFWVHELGDRGCRVLSAPVGVGKAQGHVWSETRALKFKLLESVEDKEQGINTHRYQKEMTDGRIINVTAISYGNFKRTIEIKIEVN